MSRNRQFSHFLLVIGSPAVCGSMTSRSAAANLPSFFQHACVPHRSVVVGCPSALPSHWQLLFAPVEWSSHLAPLSPTTPVNWVHPCPATATQHSSAAVLPLQTSAPHRPPYAPHACRGPGFRMSQSGQISCCWRC